MSSRKVFTDENGKELAYYVTLEGKLRIVIYSQNEPSVDYILDKTDALSFIQELNKLKKQLRDEN